jgi:hypothetical protein
MDMVRRTGKLINDMGRISSLFPIIHENPNLGERLVKPLTQKYHGILPTIPMS